MVRAALTAAMISAAAPAVAQDQCRLALQLALDVSASVDEAEYQLQLSGLASALLDENVVSGFLDGPGPVALSIFEWSGRFQQDVIIDWTLITSEDDLIRIADRILRSTRAHQDFPTAIGYALGFAATRFEDAPPCLFQTLDVSGDGQNNDGFPPDAAYAHFNFDGVTVNGLAIGGAARLIEDYYEAEIIRGPGSFVEYAADFDDFADTMRRKLERELRVLILGDLPTENHLR